MLHLSLKSAAAGLAALFAAALCAVAWQLVESRNVAMAARRDLDERRHESRRLTALDPAPTAAQAGRIDDELGAAEETLSALCSNADAERRGSSRPEGATRAAKARRDAASNAAALIRSLREQARRASVVVKSEEQFGLNETGPTTSMPESAMALERLLEATSAVVQTLFAAGPSGLDSVQRVRLPGVTNRSAATRSKPADDAAGAGDTFDVDPRFSVHEPGLIDVVAIRLAFIGRTETLRRFLNGLLAGDHLVAIGEVAVEPADAAGTLPRERHAGPDTVALLVAAAPSRFTVTIEYCELASSKSNDAGRVLPAPPQTAAGPGLSGWSRPVVQKRGRGWIYEVFTPPSVFVDRQTHALAAVPADEAAPAEPDARPPDLLLVEVRRGVFRFQLVGYAGERNDLCGIFTDMVTGGTVIGRAGEDIAPQEVLLKQLSLSQPATEKCGTGPTAEPVATATLLDETTGGEVALTTHGHALAGPPLGLFASRKTPDFHREMREGESIACNGVRYRVGRIELDPPLAVVECLTPDGSNVPGTIVLPCQSKNEKGAVHP